MKSGRTIKCMMVGDTGVGKTCAVEMFTKKNAVENCTPTAKLMKYQNDLSIDNEKVSLEIWDTPGEDDYISLRKRCYPLTDVILLVFSMVDRKSLDNVRLKLFLEVKENTKKVPIVLAGMQKDKVIDETFKTPQDGFILSMEEMISKIQADVIKPDSYHECSTTQNEGLDELFENVARAGLKYQLSDYRHGLLKFVSVASQTSLERSISVDATPGPDTQ